MKSNLFSPFRISEIELSNRIVVSPMAQYSAVDGIATQWHQMHLCNLLISGAGLLMVEATAVEPRGRVSPACLGLWTDEQQAALASVFTFRERYGGSKLGIQLAHSGRKGSVSVPWKGQQFLAQRSGGWRVIGPSAQAYPGRGTPQALGIDEMMTIKQWYVDAAIRARDLGFEFLELHCAHGYLLNSFLSPLSNVRDDVYGGSLEARMRYPLEIFEAIREVWPADRALGARLSATDWVEGGWTIEDSQVFSERLRGLGSDYISASSGGIDPRQDIPVGPGYQVPLAAAIRRAVDLPVVAAGLITEATQAETIISTGQADLVAIGRAMMYDPRWVWKAAIELRQDFDFPPQYLRSHPAMRKGNSLDAVFHKAGESTGAEPVRVAAQ